MNRSFPRKGRVTHGGLGKRQTMRRSGRCPSTIVRFIACPVPGERLPSLLMSEVTQILHAIEKGDPQAAEKLLPLVYDELRKLAARKLKGEKPGQTLQPTALVHEAYLKL